MRPLTAAVAGWLLARGVSGLHAPPGAAPRGGEGCADGWRAFSPGTPLDTTQVVPRPALPKSFADFRPGSSYQGVFLNQEPPLAFCTIEKNGCSAWNAVLHGILVNRTPVSLHEHHYVAQKSFADLGPVAATQIFSDPAAVRAVMVRDPLARFASAFLDKCFKGGCANPFCFPRGTLPKGLPIPFQQAVRWFLASDPSGLDGHWKLQSEHCELKDRVHEYTVVGFMDKGTFGRDSACILERTGLRRFNDGGGGRPFFLELAQGHEEEEEVLKKLYTKEAALSIISHTRQDYEVFHMREPRWVQEATGEWFAKVPRTCEPEQSNVQPEASRGYSALMLEDDVSWGARQAGYFD